MTTTKRTTINQIHVETFTGRVQVLLSLQFLENGVPVAGNLHLHVIAPGTDVDAAIEELNGILATNEQLGLFPPIEPDKVPMLKAICEIAWCPEAVMLRKPEHISAGRAH